nr:tyrosine-type recombinase/integrase [Streptomyces olivochromogenes]
MRCSSRLLTRCRTSRTSSAGSGRSPSSFRKVVNTLGYEWSPRDLRHWFASTALSNGLPLLDVSRWLGHKSITETADTYGHLTPDATGRAVMVMDAALTLHRADLALTGVA